MDAPRIAGEFRWGVAHENAVALAGFLAEYGVGMITLRCNGTSEVLAVRRTDLPGVIIRSLHATPATLLARGTVCELSSSGVRWQTSDVGLAKALGTLG